MVSVERRFRLFEKAYPCHSTLIVFGRTIKGMRLNRRTVAAFFNKLVDKGDYPQGQKKQFVRFYYDMSQSLRKFEDIQKQGQILLYSVVPPENTLALVTA